MYRNCSLLLLGVWISACSVSQTRQDTAPGDDLDLIQARLETTVPALLAEQKAAGVGIAIIRNKAVVWQDYFGEQGPGVAASPATVWNTASVTKTVTAETMIALAAKGLIDLDESIAPYVSHPDLSRDPRYQQLTPRLLLSHRAGLLNWAYEYDDGQLAFDHDPGQRYSYSGAGMELAAAYAEARTGKSLQTLAFEHVLSPLGIEAFSMGVIPEWSSGRLTTPMDTDGNYRPVAELNESLARGDANGAADDLLVTVPAFAQLLVGLLDSSWLTPAQVADRERIVTSLADDPVFRCPDYAWLRCPSAHGVSLGWQVFEYGEHTVLKHSGSDAGENAMVYYSPDTGGGLVLFVNGANGWVVMTRVMEIVGNEPLIADYYRGLLQSVMGVEMPPLAH